ncbi:putative Ig domain-containing protein [Hydrogenophaga sp.]|uniref:putative Ig domain-containing protein n=1 Tax=Hydrogenophaga sp. TaxID=1904254 RepID=UPI002725D2FF|nr:putative Ig domain-containing protein [Hydrogenophaga sp.]MDO9438611.1 putative Ig domain-containing protein [Hydrogenophaga sp.]
MTHPNPSLFSAAPTQRNRRLLLTLPACALPMLSACGGGGDLNYDTEQALYVVGEAITPNNPTLSGGNPKAPAGATAAFSVEPALPAGLTLNTSTGVISGTPTKLKRQATHTVTATTTVRRVRESAKTQLRITVTGRGAWNLVERVAPSRRLASLTPLSASRLLLVGGNSLLGPTGSVAAYDTTTAAWTNLSSMQYPRIAPVAVVISTGQVLVLGGIVVPSARSVELYDPADDAWTLTGDTNVPRTGCTLHVLASGKVLAVGGFDLATGTGQDTAELYDPVSGLWAPLTTPLSARRSEHASVLLRDGKTLLVVGGRDVSTAELYQVDGSATKVIPYGVTGLYHQAVTLDDGSVLVRCDGNNLSRRFNPATSSWTTSPLVNGVRNTPTLTRLSDGRVLLAGGLLSAVSDYTNTAEIYNPDLNQWTAAAPMLAARGRASAALTGDGNVIVVGGETFEGVIAANERYVP